MFLIVFVPWLMLLGALITFFASFPNPEEFYAREDSHEREDSFDPGTASQIEGEAYTTWVLILGVPFAGASLALVMVCVGWFASWAHFEPY